MIEHFYRGGDRIADMRGHSGPIGPEEWLASTVARWGSDDAGRTHLGPLGLLADLVAADPDGWLGAAHVARWGSSPALLVKLLDAGERLPVHVHPNRRFARSHLGCPFGKTEAWVVLDVPAGGGTVFVGTRRPVSRDEWAELVDAQACDEMLDLLVPITVHAGDGVVVPASTPHSIDARPVRGRAAGTDRLLGVVGVGRLRPRRPRRRSPRPRLRRRPRRRPAATR